MCDPCYQKEWGAKNRHRYRERHAETTKAWRTTPNAAEYRSRQVASVKRICQEKLQFIWGYKGEKGCADCGIKDVIVLELDHRDPALKNPIFKRRKKGNSRAWHHLSWDDLLIELVKCDVVCANCHRRRTAQQQGWANKGGGALYAESE